MKRYQYVKVTSFQAKGGPPKKHKDVGEKYERTPTQSGRFVISKIEPFLSPRYHLYSGIRWGTPMRLESNVVQVLIKEKWVDLVDANRDWKGYSNAVIKETLTNRYRDLGYSGFPTQWVFGDFGHVTIQYFKDLNQNFQIDNGEHISGDMIHTTPNDEAYTYLNKRFSLSESHGCIHVRPKDIDEMIQKGYARIGHVVEIHPYSEQVYKSSFTRQFYGRPNYEIHFFPGCKPDSCSINDPDYVRSQEPGLIIIYAVHAL